MKLINADEVKKRFPIMENDFGMVVNETLHKELDKIPTVKAIPLEKVKQAIEAQEKWLAEAGYNAYNVSIAFGSIKRALGK